MLFQMKAFYFVNLLWVVHSYMLYQEKIPNGDNVPHPCKTSETWQGVGHEKEAGGGARNSFGLDFDRNGKQWNDFLCMRDSDGDGRTNGEELGDPECKWQSPDDNAVLRTTNLSHPGICEPLDDATCKILNAVDICEENDSLYDCLSDPDVFEWSFTIPSTPVPGRETTYICQVFDVPSDSHYHVVGSDAIIDNRAVVHHMFLAACGSEADDEAVETYRQPGECGLMIDKCRNLIARWTVGRDPQCWNSRNYGFPLGKGSFQKVLMQIHWNNPDMRTGYTDSSGFKLYMTKKLKAYDKGTMMVNTHLLKLPVGQPSVAQHAVCSGECTQSIWPNDVFLVTVALHMHLLGTSINLAIYRGGEKLQEVANNSDYHYDGLTMFDLNDVQVQPGDELRVTCVYNTMSLTHSVKYGHSTSDEMCVAILEYYPFSYNASVCSSFGDLDICLKPGKDLMEYDDCNVQQYAKVESPNTNTTKEVEAKCDTTGETCLPGCKDAIAAMKTHPCEQGPYGQLVESVYNNFDRGVMLVNALHSCDEESANPDN